MNKLISNKKKVLLISNELKTYLKKFGRWFKLPVNYEDLLRYTASVTLYDRDEQDTLWVSVSYSSIEKDEIDEGLLQIYSLLRGEGERQFIEHLVVDRIDLCLYGNTHPFRVRIINTLNDNFDYFYVKNPDASRVYGLELEHILSPYRISYLVNFTTLIEEHIYGIPGDVFIEHYLNHHVNEVRLAKEFVKFNQRCFTRLLGDMHSGNYVIDITIDIEENIYRIRPIDFDQQSYEPKHKTYLPQFFKENNKVVDLVSKTLTRESIEQYQYEEKSLILKRLLSSHYRIEELLKVMKKEQLAPDENVIQLGEELSRYYDDPSFLYCNSMGALLRRSLDKVME